MFTNFLASELQGILQLLWRHADHRSDCGDGGDNGGSGDGDVFSMSAVSTEAWGISTSIS